MSFSDLYLTNSPKLISPSDNSEPVAKLFGIPFDSTHSYKPGCRFGPDVIRDASVKDGLKTLLDYGMELVKDQLTTIEEVERVCILEESRDE